jgi:hypothetical protein
MCHGCGGGGSDSAAQVASPPAQPGPTATTNVAPSIVGTASVFARVGSVYQFQPNAADRDGDSLTFSAENLPPWASLDASSGRITGTPAAGDVGEYESIKIIVADASHKTALEPFTIKVLDVETGIASLEWDTPMSKVDGSPLDDLAGYRILYGRRADDLDHSVIITSATTTAYEFTTLDEGVWYFAIVAVNANGLEGPPTAVTTKSI